MKNAAGFGADDIKTVVNTHSNGDHTFGNRLVTNAVIVASAACAKEMETEAPPAMLAEMMRNTKAMGELGTFFEEAFGPFDFAGVTLRLPDHTFSGEETLKVGDKDVKLVEVGPAHTAGDVLVHVPADRVVYTGDILFIGGTPIAWAGPVKRWIDACDRIVAMDVEAIVPGHGPITDKAARAACVTTSRSSTARRGSVTPPAWTPGRPRRTSRSTSSASGRMPAASPLPSTRSTGRSTGAASTATSSSYSGGS